MYTVFVVLVDGMLQFDRTTVQMFFIITNKMNN